MNILLTCVGRRGYLVDYFKEAVGQHGVILGANTDAMTSGMQAVDKAYLVPRVDSADYIDALLDICVDNNVELVVSLFDIDLPYLAEARSRFLDKGIQVAVSEPWVIRMANDKWETANFLQENGVPTPATFLSLESAKSAIEDKALTFPLIVKPRWGMGSISIFKVSNLEELEFFYSYSKKQIKKTYLNILNKGMLEQSLIIQEFIAGNEYGLDVFNDLEGQYLAIVAKHKLAMRSGETDAAEIVEYPELNKLGVLLSDLLEHRGNIDVDVFVGSDGIPKVLEINARFGGGYPFSHIAGANFTGALVDIVSGKEPELGFAVPGKIGIKNINPIIFSHELANDGPS